MVECDMPVRWPNARCDIRLRFISARSQPATSPSTIRSGSSIGPPFGVNARTSYSGPDARLGGFPPLLKA